MTEEKIVQEFLERHSELIETIHYPPEIFAWIEDNCTKVSTAYADYYKVNENWCKIVSKPLITH